MATAEIETKTRPHEDLTPTPRPKLIPPSYWQQFAAKNAAKAAQRARSEEISDQLALESVRQSALLSDAIKHVGSFVACTTVDGSTTEGNFTHVVDGVTKLQVPERRTPESIRLPRLAIFSEDADGPHELRIKDLASIELIDAQTRPLVWQGDSG